MRPAIIAVIIVAFNSSIIFPQRLPDFMVAPSSRVTEYFSMFAFSESGSERIGEDFLFTAPVRWQPNDSIITDALFFGFNQKYANMRIKKISVSRNGVEYCSVDSFPESDTLRWTPTEGFMKDSILLRDSLLDIRFSSEPGSLKLQLDRNYAIVNNDEFKILLDTIPISIRVGLAPSDARSMRAGSFTAGTKLLCVNRHAAFSDGGSGAPLFDLSGKKRFGNKTRPTMYIARHTR